MADEIRQDLGFNAAQALETISKLNAGFESMFQTLQAGPRTFDAFNAKAGKTNSALIQIKNNAIQAAKALGQVGNGQPATPAAGNAGGGGGASVNAQAASILKANRTAAEKYADSIAQLNKLVAAGALTQNQANAAAQRYSATMEKAGRSTSGFALSLETVVRVLGTQAIVRGLNAMVSAVESSFGSFIEFEQKLATIRTLSPEETIDQLGESLKNLSNDFNLPLLDVAEAKYQLLQNGFSKTADQADILAASFKFAQATNTNAAASVDLITSALNAYGLEASQAENISAKFFQTIDAGRISGTELVNAFGRVAPLGKELGVTVDELLAAFSSITIGGVKASEAGTQINAVMTSLLKPSEKLREAFKKIGVETGDQAVQTFGLIGAVRELIGTTDGSTAAIAGLFKNVRAIRGVLREAGSGAETFDEHLKAVQKTATATLNKAFKIRFESDAVKVTKDINVFNNFLTTEVGKTLVGITSKTLELTGGMQNLIGIAKTLLPTIGFVTVALGLYGAATAIASARTKVLSLAMGDAKSKAVAFGAGLASFAGAALLAKTAGDELAAFVNRQLDAGILQEAEAGKQRLAHQKEVNEAQSQLDVAAQAKKVQDINRFIADERKLYNERLAAAVDTNEKIRESNKATMDRIIEAHSSFAQDLKKAAGDADNQVIESRKRSTDAILKLSDDRFNRENEKLSEQSQLQNQSRRGEALFAKAKTQLLKANTDEEVKAAQAAIDRSEVFLKDALATAKTLGDKQQIFELERRQDQIVQSRIRAEERFQKIRTAEAAQLRQAAAAEESRVSKLKDAQKKFLDNSKFTDSSGNRLPEDQVKKRLQAAHEALDEFKKLSSEKGTFSATDLFSFDGLQRRLEQSVSQTELKDLDVSGEALDDVVKKIQGNLDRTKFVIKVLQDAGIDTTDIQSNSDPEILAKATEALQEKQDANEKLRAQVLKRKEIESSIVELQKVSTESTKEQAGFWERISTSAQEVFTLKNDNAIQNEQEATALIRVKIQQATNDPATDQARVDKIKSILDQFAAQAGRGVQVAVGKAQLELQILQKILDKRKEVAALTEKGVTESAVKASEAQVDQAARRIEILKQIDEAQKRSAENTTTTATQSAAWAVTINSMVASTGTIASNLQAAATAMQTLNGNAIITPTGSAAAPPQIAASTPRIATPNALTPPNADGVPNLTVTQNITSNDPKAIAQQLIPEINRVLRRQSAAIRTA